MQPDLKTLQIDKSLKTSGNSSSPRWATRWILIGVLLFAALGLASFAYNRLNPVFEVEVARVTTSEGRGGEPAGAVILSATGYVVAHHKIQVASKVVGKVSWIGVEKGDKVTQGQVIARLEDDEYRAQLQEAAGALTSLKARLDELLNGSRPEEVDVAQANLEQEKADLRNAKVNLDRTEKLVKDEILSKQASDDAKARYEAQAARVASLEKTYQLVKVGPRKELIAQVRGDIERARGQVAFAESQLANTVIRAPITGTILERIVERGEFVTTGFVGDRGAKGYVVSMADLNDLQVELDINQNDFAKLKSNQRGRIRTDAFRDRAYDGSIEEIAPEANRQKATVQVKVKVERPDEFLRPDMNASVDFLADEPAVAQKEQAPSRVVYISPAAIRRSGSTSISNGQQSIFVYLSGKAVAKSIRTGPETPQGIIVAEGLIGGEEVILNPPADLKDGSKVKIKS
jgi:HlyD family secretion protein